MGQSHPRVIIWTNYDGPGSPMLHTKFHGNRPSGSREDDFWRVFTIYGHGVHLGQVTWTFQKNLSFPHPMEALYEIWLQSAQWFQRRRCLKMLTDRQTTTMTMASTHIKSSPVNQRLRRANKRSCLVLKHQHWTVFLYFIEKEFGVLMSMQGMELVT